MTGENFHSELMRLCVHQATVHLGPNEDHDHITFEARVLFGILMGWTSFRNFTRH